MKSQAKNTGRNQELQNLARESKGGMYEPDENISRMYTLTGLAEDEMDWHLELAYPHLYWIYRVEDEIIGFIKEIPMKGDLGLIHFIYVHPDHRRNGYGSDMVKQFSRKFDSVWVEIRDDEIEGFYEQLEPTFRKVRVHRRLKDHPNPDVSGIGIPNGPHIEKTDKIL